MLTREKYSGSLIIRNPKYFCLLLINIENLFLQLREFFHVFTINSTDNNIINFLNLKKYFDKSKNIKYTELNKL